jgi:hypothetical protein
MKTTFLIICSALLFNSIIVAQKKEFYTVKAGTRVEDCIPFQERYRYPDFRNGKVYFKNGTFSEARLNYCLLMREMEYIHSNDTLALINVADIKFVTVENDTFFYDKGYLELIFTGKVKVAQKQSITLKQVLKQDTYGYAGSNSATDSYSSLESEGKTYKLVLNQDRIFQKNIEFFLATPASGFVPFNKKKIIQCFPKQKGIIENYLKSYKVDFNSSKDILRFAEFLGKF